MASLEDTSCTLYVLVSRLVASMLVQSQQGSDGVSHNTTLATLLLTMRTNNGPARGSTVKPLVGNHVLD